MGTTAFPLPIDLGPTRAAAEAAQATAESIDGRLPVAPGNEVGQVLAAVNEAAKKAYRIKATGLLRVTPDLANSVSAATAATVWTFGAWVQMHAGLAQAIYVFGLIARPYLSFPAQIQLGVGAAGSEVPLLNVLVGLDKHFSYVLPFPVPVAALTRVAVRAADELASPEAVDMKLLYVNQADLETF